MIFWDDCTPSLSKTQVSDLPNLAALVKTVPSLCKHIPVQHIEVQQDYHLLPN